MTSASYSIDTLRELFGHDDWATGRVVECMGRLGSAELDVDGGPGVRSLRETLYHLLDVEWSWIRAVESGTMPGEIWAVDGGSSPAAMWEYHRNEERPRREALLARLDDDELAEQIRINRENGQLPPLAAGSVLIHVALHSAQHRSELAAMASRHGQSPGDLDYMQFIRFGSDTG